MANYLGAAARAHPQQHHPHQYHAANTADVSAHHLHDAQGMHDAIYPTYHQSGDSMMITAGAGVLVPEMTVQDAFIANGMPQHGLDAMGQEHSLFLPLPQAPRLPVAAARASNFAAMYYDPSLHPQHVYNHNMVTTAAPWAVGYLGNPTVNGGGAFNHPTMDSEYAPPMAPSATTAPLNYPQEHRLSQTAQFHQGARASSQQGGCNANPYAPASHEHAAVRAQSVPGHLSMSMNPYQAFPSEGSVAAAASNVPPSSNGHAGYTYNHAWNGGRWTGVEHQGHPPGQGSLQRHSHAGTYDPSTAPATALHQSECQYPRSSVHKGQGAEMAGVYGIGVRSAAHPEKEWEKDQFASEKESHQWQAQPTFARVQPPQNHFQQLGHHHQRKQHPIYHHSHHPQQAHPRQQIPSHSNAEHLNHRAAVDHPAWHWSSASQNEEHGNWPSQSRIFPNQHHLQWHPSEQIGFMPPTLAVPFVDGFANNHVAHGADEMQRGSTAHAVSSFGQFGDKHSLPKAQISPDANPQKPASAPAPPSPDTLDKSAVPISSVGAEIIWIAAAALLDPSLWLSTEEVHLSQSSNGLSRKRLASQSSSSNPSPLATPFTSPYHPSNDGWHRSSLSVDHNSHAAAMARAGLAPRTAGVEIHDESSASSSEPGTPPASLPQQSWEKRDGEVHHEKHISMSALHGMRALGLSASREDGRSLELHHDRRSASPMDTQSPRLRSFRRSASYDRSRESVASVARLLQHEWRWSANDDKLESLHHAQRRDGFQATGATGIVNMPVSSPMRGRTSSQSRFSPVREDQTSLSSTGLAMSGVEASPAFRRFAHQVLAQTLVSPTAFMLGLMYSLRVLHLAVKTDSVTGQTVTDAEALEIFAQPPSAAPFKLFTLGLMIANKHLDDNTFLNKTWNEVTGISLVDLNRVERWYLEKCSYEITVPEETWIALLERLHTRTEHRVSLLNSAKRMRLPINEAPDAPRKRSDSYVVRHAGSEEAHKRFLLCVEEALQALGRAPSFSLNGVGHHLGSPLASANSDGVSYRTARPKTSLTQLHHQCHSAPAVSGDRLHGAEEDQVDVFEEENGPYRPYGTASKRSSVQRTDASSLRHSSANDTLLNRSSSDSLAPTLGSCGQEQQRTRAKRDSIGQAHAPLAPSVLLELLNKGQQLAHAAH